MPRKTLHRIESPNHARFLTFSCRHRLPLFANDTIKDAFAEHLDTIRSQAGFHLLAWVIMPEHVHLLLWPKLPEHPVADITSRLKRTFARRIMKRWRTLNAPILQEITDTPGRTIFWQPGGGYDRNISTDQELHEKIEYIHNNPVRRGLVKTPIDYNWSSARWYAGDKSNTLHIDPIQRPL